MGLEVRVGVRVEVEVRMRVEAGVEVGMSVSTSLRVERTTSQRAAWPMPNVGSRSRSRSSLPDA